MNAAVVLRMTSEYIQFKQTNNKEYEKKMIDKKIKKEP